MKLPLILLLAAGLLGCVAKPDELRSPCPDYGRYCRKTPLNANPLHFPNKEFSHATMV